MSLAFPVGMGSSCPLFGTLQLHTPMATPRESSSFAGLRRLFESRIAVLDGAMGTMIQAYALNEADFRARGSPAIRAT